MWRHEYITGTSENQVHKCNSCELIHNRHIDIRGTLGNQYMLRALGHEYITGTF